MSDLPERWVNDNSADLDSVDAGHARLTPTELSDLAYHLSAAVDFVERFGALFPPELVEDVEALHDAASNFLCLLDEVPLSSPGSAASPPDRAHHEACPCPSCR
jgi:hypothetical protein